MTFQKYFQEHFISQGNFKKNKDKKSNFQGNLKVSLASITNFMYY